MFQFLPVDKIYVSDKPLGGEKPILDASLLQGIKENGLIIPLTVRKVDDKYEIVDGNRRFLCCLALKMVTVPCVIINITDTELEYTRLYMTMNHNVPISPEQYKKALEQLIKQNPDLSLETIAQRMGKSVQWLKEKLK